MSSTDAGSSSVNKSLRLDSGNLVNGDNGKALMRSGVCHLVLEDLLWLKLIMETVEMMNL